MSSRSERALVLLVVLGLVLTTGAGRGAAASGLVLGKGPGITDVSVADEEVIPDDGEDDEEAGGGWFSNAAGSVKNAAGSAKDAVVDGARATWNAAEKAPGWIWDTSKGAGIAIVRAITTGWERAGDVLGRNIEVPGWSEFLEDHPVIGWILGPIVWLLTGLKPDGTLAFWEAGLAVIAMAIPVVKGGQAVIRRSLPWVGDAGRAANVVRKNPAGIITGARDLVRLRLAKSIAPIAENFSRLPPGSSVYIALDAQGNPLYVGMSNHVGNRLRRHFGSVPSKFADRTESIKILPTRTSREARELECRLIKALWPEFNVLHKNPLACPVYSADLSIPAMSLTPRFGTASQFGG